MKKEIDFYLISGFLGSGKTTFLQRMLNNLEGLKVGVIVNEFGNTGIDGEVLRKDGIQLVEINNGSIFCSCIKGNFIKTLIEFTAKEIDVLLIENSGLADPSNIHQIIDEVSGKAVRQLSYKGAVCILDAASFLKHVKVLAPVQNQVASSNFIIINKVDLINQTQIEQIRNVVKELNPMSFLYETIYCDIPWQLLDEKLCDNGYIGETSNQCYNRPTAYSIEGNNEYAEEEIREFIHRISFFTLRMKGFVKGKGGTWWKVDVVGDQVAFVKTLLTKRDTIEKTKLVVIGHDNCEFKEEMELAWKYIFNENPIIFE